MPQEMVAELDQVPPILAGISVGDAIDLIQGHRLSWGAHEPLMDAALDEAGLFGRHDLGAGKVGLQEIIGNDELAMGIAIDEMMSARDPEVGHDFGSVAVR
jgi:hypothetical protein